GRAGAVEHGIEPIVSAEASGRLILVRGQRHIADAGPAFHLDEPDLDEGTRILGVRPARDEIIPFVLLLNRLHDAAAGLLVPGSFRYRPALNLLVADHRSEIRRIPVWVGEHPCTAHVRDISHRAMTFESELLEPPLKPRVQ